MEQDNDTLNLKSISKAGFDDNDDPEYKQEIANIIKQADMTLPHEENKSQNDIIQEKKSNNSLEYKLNENYHKNVIANLEGKRSRGTIKNALKQTAGFPSMLDSGIQGINIPLNKASDGDIKPDMEDEAYSDDQPEEKEEEEEKTTILHNNYDTITNPEIMSSNLITRNNGEIQEKTYKDIEIEEEEKAADVNATANRTDQDTKEQKE